MSNSIAIMSRLIAVPPAVMFTLGSFAAGLNDTGQTLCYDASGLGVPCSAAVGGDSGVNPRQDARYGRDVAAAAGTLTKVGAGDAGFDFTKIANNGSALSATASLGSAATDWACTRDNVTGLVWELKTTAGLRSSAHTYTWFSDDANANGGDSGSLGTDTCGGSLAGAPYGNQCNTKYFVAAVNATALCGYTDWRLPSRRELLTVVNVANTATLLDSVYFPNATDIFHWSRSAYFGNPLQAWTVNHGPFVAQHSSVGEKNSAKAVRLVRGGL